jgi:hypothetical protein
MIPALKNHAPNFHSLQMGEKCLYFSYETVVGFYHPSVGLVVSDNVWSNTTKKHINKIGAGKRTPHAEFLQLLHKHFGN